MNEGNEASPESLSAMKTPVLVLWVNPRLSTAISLLVCSIANTKALGLGIPGGNQCWKAMGCHREYREEEIFQRKDPTPVHPSLLLFLILSLLGVQPFHQRIGIAEG